MKRVLSYLVVSIMFVLPLSVKAASGISKGVDCDKAFDANNNRTCTVKFSITDENGLEKMVVTLKESGDAEITDVSNYPGSSWTISNVTEPDANRTRTVTLTSPGEKGEGELFQFTYHSLTGGDDCYVELGYNGQPVSTPNQPDQPTDNKDTGATLPFVALGTISVIAVGAYLVTRNKTKMYKI